MDGGDERAATATDRQRPRLLRPQPLVGGGEARVRDCGPTQSSPCRGHGGRRRVGRLPPRSFFFFFFQRPAPSRDFRKRFRFTPGTRWVRADTPAGRTAGAGEPAALHGGRRRAGSGWRAPPHACPRRARPLLGPAPPGAPPHAGLLGSHLSAVPRPLRAAPLPLAALEADSSGMKARSSRAPCLKVFAV